MSDVVKKIRNVFDDTEEIASWCDDTYEGRETYAHLLGLYETALEAASEIERLRAALHQWDALIEHQYTGSRQAMSDMVDAAQNTAQILYGDPPWPDPKPRAALEAKNE